MKKLASLLLALVLCMGLAMPAFAAEPIPFEDSIYTSNESTGTKKEDYKTVYIFPAGTVFTVNSSYGWYVDDMSTPFTTDQPYTLPDDGKTHQIYYFGAGLYHYVTAGEGTGAEQPVEPTTPVEPEQPAVPAPSAEYGPCAIEIADPDTHDVYSIRFDSAKGAKQTLSIETLEQGQIEQEYVVVTVEPNSNVEITPISIAASDGFFVPSGVPFELSSDHLVQLAMGAGVNTGIIDDWFGFQPFGNTDAMAFPGKDGQNYMLIVEGTTLPGQPQQPTKPAEPEQPVEPTKPAEPEQPVEPAKPTEPVQPAAPDAPGTYTVKKGDTLGTITTNFYGSNAQRNALYKANAEAFKKTGGKLTPGMVLTLPEKLGKAVLIAAPVVGEGESLYTVKAGDTLGAIAKTVYGDVMQYKAIFERNSDRLTNANTIYEGQVIVLPAK